MPEALGTSLSAGLPRRVDAARILVVDDTEANRYALVRLLSTSGFSIVEAACGLEGIETARRELPDLIVLDVKMPDIDGFEVCRRLKLDPLTRHIPVLHVSASFIRPEDQAQGLDGGADAYLIQPVERTVLVATANALLRVRRAEEELRRAKEAAERSAREAEEANRTKDRFLAALSHELRTPLAPVLSTVQLFEAREQELSPDVRDAMKVIRRNIELEARLIDDLLDLTRVTRGKVELVLQDVDLHELIVNTVHICRDEAVGKGQSLVTDLAARRHRVRCDPTRIQQVLWNLIKNAVKFTPPKGTVTVRTSNEGPDDRLVVRVVDTGIGIEPEALSKIFNAFEQGSPAVTRQFGGLGLGLAISKALADLHGATLQAESAGRDRGSTFTLALPALAGETAPPPTPPRRQGEDGPSTLNVLLVEDHVDSSCAMARVLRSFGYDVHTASTVEDAVQKAAGARFDVVISDIGLPDGSGLDLMRRLAASDPAVSGIALSGYGMDEDRRRCAEAGFAAHLTKPVNVTQLDAEIRRITGG